MERKKASTSRQVIHEKGGDERMRCSVVNFHFLNFTSIMQIPSQSDDFEVQIEFTHTHKSNSLNLSRRRLFMRWSLNDQTVAESGVTARRCNEELNVN